MRELIEFLAKSVVENEKAVIATEEKRDGVEIIKLSVDPVDMGKIIGKEGKIIKAIRSLVKIRSLKDNKKVFLELNQGEVIK
ncbi:MAG: hypothetical protein A2172_04315 [Candidatus Woykebacteria bacterium RBG_13_40_15]|uniref:RNA-binding protein KhpA n=1 Tax=Candidatus Woykebacteria bacterium RBG_13_40_15 TaxID=1802593 RepID=A0A1G1W739_9BACT|nr:MAG: hypothetical protein A2172_04315 [Candidatus Woykebacteria bacterium RBG_13_40_15]